MDAHDLMHEYHVPDVGLWDHDVILGYMSTRHALMHDELPVDPMDETVYISAQPRVIEDGFMRYLDDDEAWKLTYRGCDDVIVGDPADDAYGRALPFRLLRHDARPMQTGGLVTAYSFMRMSETRLLLEVTQNEHA